MITDHMVAADKALSYARKRVEMSVEAWLEQGPATGNGQVGGLLQEKTAEQQMPFLDSLLTSFCLL